MKPTSLSSRIIQHWTVEPPKKTREQIVAEESLVTFCIPVSNTYVTLSSFGQFSKWYLVFAAILTQFCCGTLYAWSVLNTPIDNAVSGSDTSPQVAVYTFYVTGAAMGFSTATFGPWLERVGPRVGLSVGASFLWIGHLVTGLSLLHPTNAGAIYGVYAGSGVLTGIGLGLSYISPVSTLQKWFPTMRGTASGFAVGGFGAGSVFWGKVYLPAIDAFGLSGMFVIFGSIVALVMLGCAIVLRVPPPSFYNDDDDSRLSATGCYVSATTPVAVDVEKQQKEDESLDCYYPKDLSLIDALTSLDYAMMYWTFLASICFGLVVLSRFSTILTTVFNQTPDAAATAVALNGIFNCLGRLVFPVVSDGIAKYGNLKPCIVRKAAFGLNLACQVIIVSFLPSFFRSENSSAFIVSVWLLTLVYGSGFGLIPCFLADMFGPYHIGALHGFILTGWAVAGVGGGLSFTASFNSMTRSSDYSVADAYIINFQWLLGVMVSGFISLFFIRTLLSYRLVRDSYVFSIFGKTIINVKKKT